MLWSEENICLAATRVVNGYLLFFTMAKVDPYLEGNLDALSYSAKILFGNGYVINKDP